MFNSHYCVNDPCLIGFTCSKFREMTLSFTGRYGLEDFSGSTLIFCRTSIWNHYPASLALHIEIPSLYSVNSTAVCSFHPFIKHLKVANYHSRSPSSIPPALSSHRSTLGPSSFFLFSRRIYLYPHLPLLPMPNPITIFRHSPTHHYTCCSKRPAITTLTTNKLHHLSIYLSTYISGPQYLYTYL
jgi:hypothetical protein